MQFAHNKVIGTMVMYFILYEIMAYPEPIKDKVNPTISKVNENKNNLSVIKLLAFFLYNDFLATYKHKIIIMEIDSSMIRLNIPFESSSNSVYLENLVDNIGIPNDSI